MFCTQCGLENREDARFCYKCGQPVVLPPSHPSEPNQMGSGTEATDDEPHITKKKIPTWLIWPIGVATLLFVYTLILGFGKMAGQLGKEAAQNARSTQSELSAKISDSDEAGKYGLSIEEYQRTSKRANSYGLSIEEYQRRSKRANSLCTSQVPNSSLVNLDLACYEDIYTGRR